MKVDLLLILSDQNDYQLNWSWEKVEVIRVESGQTRVTRASSRGKKC